MTHTDEDLLALADRLDEGRSHCGHCGAEAVEQNSRGQYICVACLRENLVRVAHSLRYEAAAALRAIVAERQKPQAVRVKPLVWVETFEDRGDGTSEHNGGYEAASVLGFYEIGMGFGSDSYYWSISDPNCNDVGSFDDPTYAKAAAQADYEARILAALDVSETPAVDTQRDLVTADERQSIRDKALEDAAMCCEAEADKCDDAVKWGGAPKYIANCKAAAYAMRDRAYAIRAMKGTTE